MCYIPNLRDKTCRFGGRINNRKVEELCVFCRRTRNKSSIYRRGDEKGQSSVMQRTRYRTSCPALNSPGYVVVEADLEVKRSWELSSDVIVDLGEGNKVVGVRILSREEVSEREERRPE